MNIENEIWKEIGELSFEYVSPFNREKKEYSYNTARIKLLELSKNEDISTTTNKEIRYLFDHLSGKINAKLQEISPNYFQEYKGYKFFIEYRAVSGINQYWLKVIGPNLLHSYNTNFLKQMYLDIKKSIDRGEFPMIV